MMLALCIILGVAVVALLGLVGGLLAVIRHFTQTVEIMAASARRLKTLKSYPADPPAGYKV